MFVNTFDYNDKWFVDKGADALLSPARYLFRGKNVTVTLRTARGNEDNPLAYEYVYQKPGNRSWWKVALAIVTLIPSLLLGGVVKLRVWACSSRFREVFRDYRRSTPKEADKEIKRIHLVMRDGKCFSDDENVITNATLNLFERHLTKRFPEAEFTREHWGGSGPIPSEKFEVPKGTPIFMLNRVGKVGAGLMFGPDGEYGMFGKYNHDKYPYTVAMISDSLDGRPFLERPSVLTRRHLMSCEPELEDFDYEVYVIR